jgi:hypothetical protein
MLKEETAQGGEMDGQVALVVQTSQYWEAFVLQRIDFSISPGETVSFKFRLGDDDQAGRFGLARQGGGFIGLIFHAGTMYPDYNLGTERDFAINGVAIAQRTAIWHQVFITVDSEGRITWEVRPESPSNGVNRSIFYTLNATTTNEFFRDQVFQFYLQSGTRTDTATLYLRDYHEGDKRIVLCERE